jgi:hypothetical protein
MVRCIHLLGWCNGAIIKFSIMLVGLALFSALTIAHLIYGD